ncbi:hypothetical protein H0I39_13550 [Ottowia beijingensis]|uniref:Uncharacterized protein n=1 Tax=Ottowia beijingensis TaxID=1207057 RepID=A0A853IX92_9BURK|nr:hypothetical protein [Ottowia beijingensis]NZA02527.1 hypothetical protein [Ottowia beijingensis]
MTEQTIGTFDLSTSAVGAGYGEYRFELGGFGHCAFLTIEVVFTFSPADQYPQLAGTAT